MTFQSGFSGNPNGRPKGALSKRIQLSKLLEPHAEELINKTVEIALKGDVNALRLCIERIIPRAKDETVSLSHLGIDSTNLRNLPLLVAKVLNSVAKGELSPQEGKVLCGIIDVQRKTIETSELAGRIDSIEHILKIRQIGSRYES